MVRCYIKAGSARIIDELDDIAALSPDIFAERLDVRNVHRNTRLPCDEDGFFDGRNQADRDCTR